MSWNIRQISLSTNLINTYLFVEYLCKKQKALKYSAQMPKRRPSWSSSYSPVFFRHAISTAYASPLRKWIDELTFAIFLMCVISLEVFYGQFSKHFQTLFAIAFPICGCINRLLLFAFSFTRTPAKFQTEAQSICNCISRVLRVMTRRYWNSNGWGVSRWLLWYPRWLLELLLWYSSGS